MRTKKITFRRSFIENDNSINYWKVLKHRLKQKEMALIHASNYSEIKKYRLTDGYEIFNCM